jgi:Zn-dependent protease
LSEVEIIKTVAMVLALAVAIIGHEIMHGLVAYKFGDDTAKNQNRLSINPIVHVDIVGTIIVPALLFFSNASFLFGWAKPVPVNMYTVISNGGYKGATAVSLAGVAYNFFLASLFAVFTYFIKVQSIDSTIELFFVYFIIQSIIYNVVLGVFNLWPIPPLDGSNALSYIGLQLGSNKIANFMDRIGRYGMVVLIIILATPISSLFFMPASFLIDMLLPK